MSAVLNHNKLGELDTLSIHGDGFRAVVLLQGAQLIHFITDDDTGHNIEHKNHPDTLLNEYTSNWLWVSKQAVYQSGMSVRGGVPICWPVFGMFEANPPQVKQSFANCAHDVSKHGFARVQRFALDSFESRLMDDALGEVCQLIMTLPTGNSLIGSEPSLHLKVSFMFSKQGFSITLITQNNSPDTIHYSQALHTYLPTDDIVKTSIAGFDGITYSDTLNNWQQVIQKGDIKFCDEVDRIYHNAPTIYLNTQTYRYTLTAQGSRSTVVWNPWRHKAQEMSQFVADEYQRMLCIETANAHLDSVSLEAGDAHRLSMTLRRQKI